MSAAVQTDTAAALAQSAGLRRQAGQLRTAARAYERGPQTREAAAAAWALRGRWDRLVQDRCSLLEQAVRTLLARNGDLQAEVARL